MHSLDDLAAALAILPGASFRGVLYRAIDLEALYGFHRTPPYPRPRPLYGLGAPESGARFTPRGGPASLYLAGDRQTALAEAAQVQTVLRSRTPAVDIPDPPTVLVSVEVLLEAVLDLTEPTVQDALGTDRRELTRAWRRDQRLGQVVPTQQLGAMVFGSGRFQAIRYQSARVLRGSCFVVFPHRLSAPSFIAIYDPHGNLRERIP